MFKFPDTILFHSDSNELKFVEISPNKSKPTDILGVYVYTKSSNKLSEKVSFTEYSITKLISYKLIDTK